MEEWYVSWFVYLPTRFDCNVLSEYKDILSKLFLWEIIMRDKFFWFSRKSSSGLVDIAMWKNSIYIYIYIYIYIDI